MSDEKVTCNCGRDHSEEDGLDTTGEYINESPLKPFLESLHPHVVRTENWSQETYNKIFSAEVKKFLEAERNNILTHCLKEMMTGEKLDSLRTGLAFSFMVGYHLGQAHLLGKDA